MITILYYIIYIIIPQMLTVNGPAIGIPDSGTRCVAQPPTPSSPCPAVNWRLWSPQKHWPGSTVALAWANRSTCSFQR